MRIDVFEAVQAGSVERGIVPFENSTNGSVVFTLDLFADRLGACPDIYVVGETYLSIHHFLLGRLGADDSAVTANSLVPAGGTRPLHSVKHVTQLYSHPQAFGQCDVFLKKYLKGVERQEVSSTARAAEIVASDASGASAAIASAAAARVQKLTVLAEGIEDRDDNTTRFLILRKGVGQDPKRADVPARHHKTLVSFTIDDQAPGALADALTVFKCHALNLTSINSRPSRVAPWHYVFFVEFQGSRIEDEDGAVGEALDELRRVTRTWRWLGSWPDELRRGE